ncbi:MAG: isoprenylcysteine carboxylmethyltransferase family protein [Deltaproteobacteria bacterium]|nr:isoprenylcysteine carboxylmethyltransferase family protein [Candidatus Deferrimicrobium borealis]
MKDSFEKRRIAISRIFSAAVIGMILVSRSHWRTEAPLLGAVLFCLGAVLVGVASLGRMWCSLYIAGYKTSKLITEGPYSMTRNPLYFFSFLGTIGVGLATETILFTVVMLVAFAIYYPLVIRSEERKLLAIHHEEFTAYVEKTPRFFPKFSALKEPQTYEVTPVVYRKNSLDAVWFVWVLGALEIIKGLHASGILPAWFTVY